jgi:hypothetical protein
VISGTIVDDFEVTPIYDAMVREYGDPVTGRAPTPADVAEMLSRSLNKIKKPVPPQT